MELPTKSNAARAGAAREVEVQADDPGALDRHHSSSRPRRGRGDPLRLQRRAVALSLAADLAKQQQRASVWALAELLEARRAPRLEEARGVALAAELAQGAEGGR